MQGIRLPVNNGPWAGLYIGVTHGGAVMLLAATGLPLTLQISCCIAVLLHGGYWLLQYSPRHNRRLPRELLLTPAGDWWLWHADGESLRVDLQPGAFISPMLLVLRFRCSDGERRAFIHADRHNAAILRRLRVRLLHATS